MRPILAGIETEYGLIVDNRGAEDQVDDATALVAAYPGPCHVGWDYRYESPRADLRGFTLKKLSYDPVDAKFDFGRARHRDENVRADRILPNGARLYNDHGHPEYSTPECKRLTELANHDASGQTVVLRCGQEREKQIGARIRLYKNNTDFHGASYGTHENYLMPREIGFERLYRDLMPMLVVRQVLVGAGKVGAESEPQVAYQLSQRADFFVETANAETLYRRPIFNTRDEPHANPEDWIRLHVICGDANMIPSATARKVGLVKLALHLCENGTAPKWSFRNPVEAFRAISRDDSFEFRIQLEGSSWTNAYEVFESYFAAAERTLELDEDMAWVISSSRRLLANLRDCRENVVREIDWAAKRSMLEQFMDSEQVDWNDPALRAYDLEYHNVDPSEGLYAALVEMDQVDAGPTAEETERYLSRGAEGARSFARGLAVAKFGDKLTSACWRTMTFRAENEQVEVEMPPDANYPQALEEAESVESFIQMLRGVS